MCFRVLILVNCVLGVREQPNILFVLADDLGWSDVSWNNENSYSTPFMHRLMENATKLTQSYSTHRCTPTLWVQN